MKDRIKALRKSLNMSQAEFGEKLGIKQTTVAGYETGAKNPMDAVVTSICRTFDVREEWLRDGQGEMLITHSREERIAAFVGDVLSDESDTFKKRFILMLSKLDESGWKVLEKMVEGMKKD